MAQADIERLYDEHAQALFAFLLNLTRHEADTRDLLQELFVKLANRPELLDDVRDEPLDPVTMRERGLGFGCGVVSFSGPGTCGVAATAEIMTYMAGATAAQCGPCVFGLADIAQAVRRLADGTAPDHDLDRIGGWAALVEGRGACHHPDGAIALLRSALHVFADDFARHQARRRCPAGRAAVA